MAQNQYYLTEENGKLKRESAINTSAGAADADKLIRLDANGEIPETMLPNLEVKSFTAFENLSAGDLIYIRSDGQIAKADATTSGKEAVGFVKTAITAATSGNAYFEGTIAGLVGLTVGSLQFLSTTAGARTETAPSSSGNIIQQIGRACSATEIIFEAQQTIELD